MNAQLLIDAVVRQTTVLIAQLATSGGIRAPLAHVANQVFLELTQELNAQGVSRKVCADMFGMALRAYLKKIHRLSESSTERGRSLWEAVLAYLTASQVKTKAEVLNRFRHDDESLVRGVLHDLVDSGLVFSAGRGVNTVFRATTADERGAALQDVHGLEEFLWVLIYREGPLSQQRLLQLAASSTAGREAILAALQRLVDEQRIETDKDGLLTAQEFLVPLGSTAGWEAATYDHYHAVVKTLAVRLRQITEGAPGEAGTGCSTYTYDVWPGHPEHETVLGTLSDLRQRLSQLRQMVDDYNKHHPVPPNHQSVVVYAGQCVTAEQPPTELEHD